MRSTVFSRQPLLFAAVSSALGAELGFRLFGGTEPVPFVILALAAALAALVLQPLRPGGWVALCALTAVTAASCALMLLSVPSWYGQWGDNREYSWVSGTVVSRRHGDGADVLLMEGLTACGEGGERPLEGILALTLEPQRENEDPVPHAPCPLPGWQDAQTPQVRVGDRLLVVDAALRLPHDPGDPTLFNARLYWAQAGVRFLSHASQEQAFVIPGSGPARWLDSFRLWLYGRMQRDMGPEGARLAAALLMGWTGGLDQQRSDYDALGIAHVLAVSGLHMSLILALVQMWGLRRAWLAMHTLLVQLVLVGVYYLLAGIRPSFNRVLLTMLLSGAAMVLSRESDGANTLCAAFLIQLVLCPLAVLNPACRLTYLAALTLHLLQRRSPARPWLAAGLMSMTVVWVLLPYSMADRFPLAAGLANVLLTPVYLCLVGAAFLYLLVSPIPPLAGIVGFYYGQCASALSWAIGLAASLAPAVHIPVRYGAAWLRGSSALVLLSSPRLLGRRLWLRRLTRLTAAVLVLAAMVLPHLTGGAQVTVLGQGWDSAVYAEDPAVSLLILRGDVYAAEEPLLSGLSGGADALVYLGGDLSELEAVADRIGRVEQFLVPRSYWQRFPQWIEALCQRCGARLALLEPNQPLAMGSFTLLSEGSRLTLLRGDWQLTFRGTHLESRQHGRTEAIYHRAYFDPGLDESKVTGYNRARYGVWTKIWR